MITTSTAAHMNVKKVYLFVEQGKEIIAVFHVPSTTSIHGRTARFTEKDLINNSRLHGLPLSIGNGQVQNSNVGWKVILTSGGVYLWKKNLEGESLLIANKDKIYNPEIACNLWGSQCSVYITPVDIGRPRNFSECKVKIGKKSIAFKSEIFCSIVEDDGRYHCLSSEGGSAKLPPFPSRIIIDQNILLDIDDYFTQKNKRRYDPNVLIDWLLWCRINETLPGLALAENRVVSGPEREREIRYSWESTSIGYLINQSNITNQTRDFYESNSFPEIDYESIFEQVISIPYLNLLHALEPWIYLSNSSHKYSIEESLVEYERWVEENNKDGIGFSKMMLCVESLFFEKPNSKESQIFAKLLKINRKPPFSISSLKGAAFDVSLPSHAARLSKGIVKNFPPKNTYIWTADSPLYELNKHFEQANIPFNLFTQNGPIPLEERHLNFLKNLSKRQIDNFNKISHRAQIGGFMRLLREKEINFTRATAEIKKLEELLIKAGIVK